MLRWSFGFFILTFVAALLGLTGNPPHWIGVTKLLFYGFLSLFVLTFALGLYGARKQRSNA